MKTTTFVLKRRVESSVMKRMGRRKMRRWAASLLVAKATLGVASSARAGDPPGGRRPRGHNPLPLRRV
eukprot:4036788-Pleurochrysis_carterae.AAC.1